MRRVWVNGADGVRLSVTVDGPDGGIGQETDVPTVVCVHGYPDDSTLWDGVRTRLRGRFRVVTYDVRGAGDSDAPREVAAYRLDTLAADLVAVLDEVAGDRPVHLLAHDWGSIQTWHAVTGPWLRGRVASFTSISGPDLDHAAHWFRAQLRPHPRRLGAALRQLARSGYLAFFQLPVLPELLWRSGLGARVVRAREPAEPAPRHSDAVHGLNLYRANIVGRLRRPGRRPAEIPVQVLAPVDDPFVGVPLQTEIARWVPDLRVRRIPGSHWVVRADPDRIATATAELVDAVEPAGSGSGADSGTDPGTDPGTGESRALRRARVNPPPRGRFPGRLVLVTG
ncbi:alpha/beta fold hydrolase, partial [Saccharomonospora iraqiensis]|uniref:alpha/beta fold hydrolase n=1 Tax=Saccharomonospora iraqiensis TaxID=52698 RepID=UPI00022E0B13